MDKSSINFDGYVQYDWACSNGQAFVVFVKGFQSNELPDVTKILTRKRKRKMVPTVKI